MQITCNIVHNNCNGSLPIAINRFIRNEFVWRSFTHMVILIGGNMPNTRTAEQIYATKMHIKKGNRGYFIQCEIFRSILF